MIRYARKKQRHTAKRIWRRLQDEGFIGGYTIVKDAVREIRRTSREVYMPLKHPPGEAQVDFGYALVKMAGVLRKIAFFVMALPHSDAVFVKAYERECTETFWDGHVSTHICIRFLGAGGGSWIQPVRTLTPLPNRPPHLPKPSTHSLENHP